MNNNNKNYSYNNYRTTKGLTNVDQQLEAEYSFVAVIIASCERRSQCRVASKIFSFVPVPVLLRTKKKSSFSEKNIRWGEKFAKNYKNFRETIDTFAPTLGGRGKIWEKMAVNTALQIFAYQSFAREGGGWGGRIKMRKVHELQNGRFLKCVYSLTQFWQLVRQYQVTILCFNDDAIA